jgi:hypothetical protein
MTLFTIKKATVIYLLISSIIFTLSCSLSFATEDLASFCFKRPINLVEAQKNLEFLLLPHEQIYLRTKDYCIDVNTSTDRAKLLEKFLRKSYTLVEETRIRRPLVEGSLNNQNCQLELKTTKKKKVENTDAQVGIKNGIAISSGVETASEVSTSEILLGLGKPGFLEMDGHSLYVECSGGGRGIYQLVFSYSELYRSKVSSEVTVKQGESVQIAQITNDLNNKSKMLGLPESIYQEAAGSENINYELQIK